MEEVKRNDLNIFKNEVLGDMKKLEFSINEKISKLSKELQNSNLINENKFDVHEKKLQEIAIKSDTTDFQANIKDKIDKNIKKIDDVMINNSIKIQKIEKDLANACYKYDNLYIKNMSSPGLIGDGCPYPTMKAFFIFLEKKIKELVSTKEKTLSEFNKLKTYLDKSIEKLENQIRKNEEEINTNLIERLKENNKFVSDKTKKIEDRFEYIRIENSKHIFNVIKNQEIINEKLKLELKRYSLINETLINFYKKQNRIANSDEKDKKYKSLLNTKSKNKISKKVALDINELLPALHKIEESYNINTNLFAKNEEKVLKIEDNQHFEIKNPRKKESFMKTIIKDNNLFLRRSIAYTDNNKKILKPYSHLYNDDNSMNNKNINNNKNLNKTIEYKFIMGQKLSQKDVIERRPNIINIKNTKSEKKINEKFKNENLNTIHGQESIKKIIQKEKNKKELKGNYLLLDKLKSNVNEDEDEDEDEDGNQEKETVKKDKDKEKDKEMIPVLNININSNKKQNLDSNKMNTINQEKYIISKTAKKSSNINLTLKKVEKSNEKENDNEKQNNEELANNTNINSTNNIINTITNSLKDENKIFGMKIEDKINKYILKNNERINEKFEFIKKHIYFLLNELNKIIKEKEREKHKIKANIILKPSNSLSENVNLKNLYISNDSIIPMTKKSFEKSVKNNDKSNNVSLNENRNIKKIMNNSRVIRTSHNRYDINKNDSNDKDNYCMLLNKIEPFLIKKFSE
jgi:hypothetical protein